jgi:tetratricopeptide (TPR) repeat protein
MESASSRLARALARLLDRADDAIGSERRWVIILFAVAFVLKLVYIVQSSDALHVRVPVMDSKYYDETAQGIASGSLLQREAFFMGPLYPYLLSLVYLIFGRDFMIVRVLQILVGSASVALTFVIGKRVFRPSVALLGALMLMFYGTITFYEGLILMTWLGTILNLATIALLLRAARADGSALWYGAAGVTLGLSALARANVLVFAPVVIVWILWVVRGRRRVAAAGAFAAAVVVALSPATIHNYIASRDVVPVTSNAGLNFFIGNNEVATGVFRPLPEIDFVRDPTSRSYIEQSLGKDMGPSEVSRYWFARSLEFIRENPSQELRLLARKFALFFNGYEIPQIEAYALERQRNPWLRVLFVNFWWICALGLTGLLFSLGRWREHILLSGFLVVYAASIILFFVTARYRVQIAPILCLFAAHALLGVAPGFFRGARRTAVFVGALALLLLLTNPGLFALESSEVMFRQHIHDARRLSTLGDHEPALEEIDKAIALYPDFYEGYWQRAVINKEKKDLFSAIEDYSRTLDRRSDLPTVHYDFGQTLRQLGLRSQAIDEYKTAIALDPLMIEAHNNLGITYREVKRYDDAIASFERVIELDPGYAKAYNNLGASLAESGRVDEAVVVFTRAIRMFPDYPNTYMNLAMACISLRRSRPAIDAVEGYLRLRPDDKGARELLAKLHIAAAADSVGNR